MVRRAVDGEPFDVVNNVGTHLVDDGYAADRGWLERDHGQYERHEDVFAWCGAAVLLRADYLRDVGHLRRTPLPLLRGRRARRGGGSGAGWRHRYVPALRRAPRALGHLGALDPGRHPEGAQPAARARCATAHPGLIARALLRYVLVTVLLHPPRRASARCGPAQPVRPTQVQPGFGPFWRLPARLAPRWCDLGARTERRRRRAEPTSRLQRRRADSRREERAVPAAAPSRRPRMVDHG